MVNDPVDEVARTQWAENGRFYSDGRFKQLTLFVGGLTLAGAGIAQYRDVVITPGITMGVVLAQASMLFTAVMWVLEVRFALLSVANWRRVPDLAPQIAIRGFSWLNGTTAVGALKCVAYGSFWSCAKIWGLNRLSLAIWAAVGMVLVVFTVVAYYPQREYGSFLGRKEQHTPDTG